MCSSRITYVYILACAGNKYYVGYSGRLHERLTDHFLGQGAIFTRLNKPQRLLSYRKGTKKDEFREYCAYVAEFGIKKVGGYNEALALKEGFEWPFSPQFAPIPRKHLMKELEKLRN